MKNSVKTRFADRWHQLTQRGRTLSVVAICCAAVNVAVSLAVLLMTVYDGYPAARFILAALSVLLWLGFLVCMMSIIAETRVSPRPR
jgi:hypothetical protein